MSFALVHRGVCSISQSFKYEMQPSEFSLELLGTHLPMLGIEQGAILTFPSQVRTRVQEFVELWRISNSER